MSIQYKDVQTSLAIGLSGGMLTDAHFWMLNNFGSDGILVLFWWTIFSFIGWTEIFLLSRNLVILLTSRRILAELLVMWSILQILSGRLAGDPSSVFRLRYGQDWVQMDVLGFLVATSVPKGKFWKISWRSKQCLLIKVWELPLEFTVGWPTLG